METLAASPPVVMVRDVTIAYGSHRALSHVTAAFGSGATGLLGPNGAGKSSLILAILGLVRLQGGQIEVLGLNVDDASQDVRARVGYAPEADARLPAFTAVSSVAHCGELARLPRGDALQRAHEVLTYVGLGEVRYRPVETFSMGMKQRLKLAQAIVHDPPLLLLDEPTDGMVPRGREQMLALIRDLAHRHEVAVILSSHILKDVEETCDSVVVLDHGQVVRAGPIANSQASGEDFYDVRIKGDEEAFMEALTAAGFPCERTEAGMIHVALYDGAVRALFGVANRLGVQVRHLQRQRVFLEDLFAAMTGGRSADRS